VSERAATARPEGVRVDIVIDNHDYERYLREAIDSALAQTHPLTRVIVVDDGSTDGSRQVIASYGDRVETVLKPNGGQASAMNAGVERCRGDVVMFLDADDVLEPDAAARVAAEFLRRPDLARVHFRLRVVDGAGILTGEIKPPPRLPLAEGDLRAATLTCPFDAAWLPTSGNAFAAWALRRIAPVPEEEYRISADWYLVHASSLVGPVGAIDAALGRYRVHGHNSFTRAGTDLDLDHVAETAAFAEKTRRHLLRIARAEGLDADPGRMASMCDVGGRAVLTRLAPTAHRDSRTALLRLGARACRGRRDVGLALKAAFMAWLGLTLAVPRPVAARLGALFLIPETRPAANGLLGRLHRE
jgi:hypothetical protein